MNEWNKINPEPEWKKSNKEEKCNQMNEKLANCN